MKVVRVCLVIDHDRLLGILMTLYDVSVFPSKVENEVLYGVEVMYFCKVKI